MVVLFSDIRRTALGAHLRGTAAYRSATTHWIEIRFSASSRQGKARLDRRCWNIEAAKGRDNLSGEAGVQSAGREGGGIPPVWKSRLNPTAR
jgi:hypothetical protein